ncbi:MAG: hypothetical protein NTV61_10730 [Candidatus Bathyarchaeota archaeon]|nr:hypothetical protein [Candidatus Bathyarchaeota archaeon]
MNDKFDYVLLAVREIQACSIEMASNLGEFVGLLREVRDLYAVDRDTSKSPLISLGITLLVLPDPITTPIGAVMILAGFAQQKFVGPPLYIKDIYQSFNQNVLDLFKDSGSLSGISLPPVFT